MNTNKCPQPEDGFWYASVGGAPTEIIRVHKRKMYSTGCADPHSLNGVELIERIPSESFPLSGADKAKQAEQRRVWELSQRGHYQSSGSWQNYRRFE